MSLRRLRRAKYYSYSSAKNKLLTSLSTLILTGILGLVVLIIVVVVFFATQVPSPEQLTSRNIEQSTKIYDRNGELLYDIFKNENRTTAKLSDIPDNVKKSTIA